jgi:hypothetical protein
MELQSFCQLHNIGLVYVMPPKHCRAEEYYAFHDIGPERSIDMGDPDRYPEFHQMGYHFDKGHLNDAGARLYTLELAKQVLAANILSGMAQRE